MMGTVVNALAIVAGAFLGKFIKGGLPDKYKDVVMQAVGMAVIIIGISGALRFTGIDSKALGIDPMLMVVISLMIGGIVGEWLKIEQRLDSMAAKLQSRFAGEGTFAQAFVTASLVYCVGAMAIMGSLESGLSGNHQTLFAKSILDGVTAVIFSSSLGIGVAFAAIPVFIYQGVITLSAAALKGILTPPVIEAMSSIGGVLIMGIGISLLDIKRIKIGNLLPSIFLPLIYELIRQLL